jgi:hypothetical protein
MACMLMRLSLHFTVLSFVLLAWILSVWFETDRVCIPSDKVTSLTVITSRGQAFPLPACQGLSRLFEPHLSPEERQHIKAGLARLNRVVEALPNLIETFQSLPPILVTFEEPHHLYIRQDQIQVGSAWVQSGGVFEKILLQAVLNTGGLEGDRFALEVLSDFFAAVVMNSYSFDDFLGEPLFEDDPFLWSTFVFSFREYCYSNLKSVFHFDYCLNQNALLGQEAASQVETPEDMTIWGLRPFLAHALWQHYQKLPLSEKGDFLKNALNRLQTSPFSYPKVISKTEDLKIWISETLALWFERHDAVPSLEEKVDVLVQMEGHSPEALLSVHQSWLEHTTNQDEPSISSAFVSSRRVQHEPTGRDMHGDVNAIEARKVLIISCKASSPALTYNWIADEVVLVQHCDSEPLDWHRILQLNLANFSDSGINARRRLREIPLVSKGDLAK